MSSGICVRFLAKFHQPLGCALFPIISQTHINILSPRCQNMPSQASHTRKRMHSKYLRASKKKIIQCANAQNISWLSLNHIDSYRSNATSKLRRVFMVNVPTHYLSVISCNTCSRAAVAVCDRAGPTPLAGRGPGTSLFVSPDSCHGAGC